MFSYLHKKTQAKHQNRTHSRLRSTPVDLGQLSIFLQEPQKTFGNTASSAKLADEKLADEKLAKLCRFPAKKGMFALQIQSSLLTVLAFTLFGMCRSCSVLFLLRKQYQIHIYLSSACTLKDYDRRIFESFSSSCHLRFIFPKVNTKLHFNPITVNIIPQTI